MVDTLQTPDTFGFIAAILTTIAFLPQLIKTYKTKSAEDVSMVMLLMFIIGVFFWIIYGWKSHSFPVLIANIITFVLNLLILFGKVYFSEKDKLVN